MKNKNMIRGVLFEESDEKEDIVFDYKSAFSVWGLKNSINANSNKLKKALGINDIIKVKLRLLNNADESDDSLRLYVYKTKHCNIKVLKNNKLSHGLQISLGNKTQQSDWMCAEGDFTAKVFVDSADKLMCLIEDVILDIQMFYFYGFDKIYKEVENRRDFSLEKVDFLKGKGYNSYLGNIANPQYISFASFCREPNSLQLDFNKYIKIWNEFNKKLKEILSRNIKNVEMPYGYSKDNLSDIILLHPRGKQLSLRKIEKILNDKPAGEYLIIRTEKKPKKSKQRIKIERQFGMKKWKTGKLKIVSSKYRFSFQKMIPYVSIFEINWRG